jgi:hypothetical protein
MEVSAIIAGIDEQISKLTEARQILEGQAGTTAKVTAGRGRPKGSTKAAAPAVTKRQLSPEGRKRIADAMKRRWADRRKAASK